MSERDERLQQLLDGPPTEVEAWLATNAPPRFNWRGLAEGAGWNALHKAGDTADALAWARVSRLARERLTASTPEDPDEESRSRRTDAHLRAELINRHGCVPGDPFLDCEAIFEQFLGRYGDRYDEIARDGERWTELPIERIRDLRFIKNELNVLRGLDQCATFADPQVQRWLQLWQRLP